jgi:hypothetical protein
VLTKASEPQDASAVIPSDVKDIEVPELLPRRVERPWTPEDQLRGRVTNWLLAIFTVTAVGSFIGALWGDAHSTNTKELLQVLLPAETGLIGSAIGFYFGAKK